MTTLIVGSLVLLALFGMGCFLNAAMREYRKQQQMNLAGSMGWSGELTATVMKPGKKPKVVKIRENKR